MSLILISFSFLAKNKLKGSIRQRHVVHERESISEDRPQEQDESEMNGLGAANLLSGRCTAGIICVQLERRAAGAPELVHFWVPAAIVQIENNLNKAEGRKGSQCHQTWQSTASSCKLPTSKPPSCSITLPAEQYQQ